MKITRKSPLVAAGALAMMTPLSAAVYNFGSAADGLAGFTQTAGSATQIWNTATNSVQYRNEDPGAQNSSFLRSFVLDRSFGSSYQIQGVVTLTDGYADDNNRVGMYLFGDNPTIADQLEAGAAGLIFNADDSVTAGPPGNNADDNISLQMGIDGGALSAVVTRDQTTPFAQDLFGTAVTFTADITFTNAGMIDIVGSLNAAGDVTTTSTSVLASEYTGDYFGFVTRARARLYGDANPPAPENRNVPWGMDYESFSVIQTAIPEPATTSLLGALAGLLMFRRRRAE